MGIMKFARLLAVGAVVVSAVSGCTATGSVETGSEPTAALSTPTPISTPTPSRVLAGKFVSQAATTSGEVLITEEPGSLVLTLTDFSTGPGDDLYINLNPGFMTQDPEGNNVLNNPNTFQVAALKSRTGTQSYDLTHMLPGLSEVRSVTIYSSSSRQAFGTANLQEK